MRKPFPGNGTRAEKEQWLSEQRQRLKEAELRRAEVLLEQSEAVLLGASDICTRAGLPCSQIRIFGIGNQNETGLCYDGKGFHPWTPFSGKEHERECDLYWQYIDRRSPEIHPNQYREWTPPFALLRFESLDQAQSLIGFKVPWITLGYWRLDDEHDPFAGGKFYRLWLLSEKLPAPNNLQ